MSDREFRVRSTRDGRRSAAAPSADQQSRQKERDIAEAGHARWPYDDWPAAATLDLLEEDIENV